VADSAEHYAAGFDYTPSSTPLSISEPQVVQEYADDLRSLLAKSSIAEQRSFLRSFVERIEVDRGR